MLQKGLRFLALFLFFLPSFSFSFDIDKLSHDRHWKQLLHFRDGKSEIDSPTFFLSPKGKTDAKAELKATIDALHLDKKIFCRFPSRIKWLYKQIPSLEKEVPYEVCKSLETLIKEYDASKAVLVFPTAHINSPASMFGHTFLRLDDKKGLALTANAINYAAKAEDKNGFAFAYKGLFGGYKGRYSVLPYYKKIKEYNDLERRDIWEYTLNLNKDELRKLLMHLYEVKDEYADYYFATENCSYNLLWLLEVAREDVYLVDKFSIKAMPVDTVRAVKEAGLIESSHFRHSKTKRIQAVKKGEAKATGKLKEAFKTELEVELLQLKRTKTEIEKKPYIKKLMTLLAKRSKLPKLPKLKIKTPTNPLSSHKTARISLGFDEDKDIELGMKLAFHDIYDLEGGFIFGAYIDFMHLVVAKDSKDTIKIKKLDVININSYAPRDSIFKPLSWGVSTGLVEFRDKTHLKLTGEVGFSYGTVEDSFVFAMMKPLFYYKDEAIVGLAPKVGMIVNFSKLKFGTMIEKNFYSDGEKVINSEAFTTIKIAPNMALNFILNYEKAEYLHSDKTVGASLFYYF